MMNKNEFITIKLGKGEMNVYDFGSVKLHAYKTNDPIDNEVFIVEKDAVAVIVEAPCFFENIRELTTYLEQNKLSPAGMLLAYHMAGASFLPGVPVYATANADDYGHNGGGAALIRNFKEIFGDSFDCSIFTVTNSIGEGNITIGGIEFVITQTQDAFDIEIPAIHAVYTHMLGHDCHSIVAGAAHADAMIAQLEGYLGVGYDLVLTSHDTPEDLKDVAVKIAYIKNLKRIAQRCGSAEEFKEQVKREYGNYGGKNYLDMTAGFFFAEA